MPPPETVGLSLKALHITTPNLSKLSLKNNCLTNTGSLLIILSNFPASEIWPEESESIAIFLPINENNSVFNNVDGLITP